MPKGSVRRGHAIEEREIETDRPPERLLVQRLVDHPEIEFWSVRDSVRHWGMVHDTYTACFVLGGHYRPVGRWYSRGSTRNVGPGCVQLMEPGEAHRTVAVSEPASFFVMWWSPAALERAARELDITGNLHFRVPQLEPGSAPVLAELARGVNEGADRLAIESNLAEGTRQLLDAAAEGVAARTSPGGRHVGVRRAVERLHDCYRDSVSLEELASAANLSKFHLVRCFREATGFPPHQYQKLLRIAAARRLIGAGVTVQEAAARTGFADGPHLSRAFRGWVGSPPGAWSPSPQRRA